MSGKRASHRFVIDVSNLSIHAKKWIRTGIQEVVYQTLLGLVEARSLFPGLELVLLPALPRRFGNLLQAGTTVPYQNPPSFILEAIEDNFRMSSKDVWGIDLKARGYQLTDEEAFEQLTMAERIHIQGMVNVEPMMQSLRRIRAPAADFLSMTVYDLAPVFFPEYCDHGLARWFQETYLRGVSGYVKNAVCISRNTAIDVMNHPFTKAIPKVTVLPLPCKPGGLGNSAPDKSVSGLLEQFGLESQDFLVYLGSLEPRKYFDAILSGYETFRNLSPSAKTKLVMVGGTGWKNFTLEKRLGESRWAKDIVRTGYLEDSDRDLLLQQALALMMVSQYEGYGLPLAQALSKGCQVITSWGSSLPEACGGAGIFVEPHDRFSVCAGIQRARDQVKRRESVRRSGGDTEVPHLFSSPNWTWGIYAQELVRLMGDGLELGL